MFNNCGPKVKTFALVFFILGLAGSFIGGIALMDADEGMGIAVMLGGALFSYIFSLMLATFGEIAENTAAIAKNTQNMTQAPAGAAPQQPATPTCPTCGKAVTTGAKFCTGCGTPL